MCWASDLGEPGSKPKRAAGEMQGKGSVVSTFVCCFSPNFMLNTHPTKVIAKAIFFLFLLLVLFRLVHHALSVLPHLLSRSGPFQHVLVTVIRRPLHVFCGV
jgi:hypothetical protein